MILILTHFSDITVVRLGQMLREMGHAPLVLAPSAMNDMGSFSVEPEDGGATCRLRLGVQNLLLSDIRSVWLWRSWQRFPDERGLQPLVSQSDDWTFFRSEWLAFHKSLASALAYSGIFCVNPPPFGGAAEEKCGQLLAAARCGLRVPPTLYTTRLGRAREFHDAHGGSIIYKPFTSYARVEQQTETSPARAIRLYTQRIRAEELVESEGFIPTPGIFQPYVDKALELRIVVIGERLFACAIHSQGSNRSRDDWRRMDLENTPYEPYALPEEVANKLRHLMRELKLVFGSIDMILTPSGEYVFLEVNPYGQFDWIAKRGRLPLYENLAAMLVAGRVDYPAPVSHAA